MSMLSASIPPVSEEFFNKLNKSFPVLTPEPNVTTMDELMHNAGERKVVEWIRQHMRGSIVTGSSR